jgi:hypothetical protein
MGLQAAVTLQSETQASGNVQGTISPAIQTTLNPLPTTVVPPETNSKVSDQ